MARKIDINIEVKDGEVNLAKYIHLHPRLLLHKNGRHYEDQKYKDSDDMYSVGMIMWELWTGSIPPRATGTQTHNQAMVTVESKADHQYSLQKEVGKYLEQLVWSKSPHFNDEQDITTKIWWTVMSSCLDSPQAIRASDWLNEWDGHSGYPPLSMVSGGSNSKTELYEVNNT